MSESRRPARRGQSGSGARNSRPRQARRPDASRAGLDEPRVAARDVLRAVRERDAYANLVLPGLLRERRLDGRDAALATELAYGAARARGLLDAVISDCAGRPIEEIDGPLLDVLQLGTYQLLRTRVAPHAAVATSVDLVRAESGHGKAGFVNAVLRRVSERTESEWVERLAPTDPVGRLAFAHAHPTWIAQAFADALGPDAGELEDVLVADDARPTVHLVARPGEISAEELALVTGGEVGRYSPYAVYLDGGDPGLLDAVREGLAGVQDEGSQLVARALSLAPLEGPDGGRWLDLCAGPGGKAALLGALAGIVGGRVDAVEPVEHRADLIRKTTKELPVDVTVADGRDPGLEHGYDRVLVDAPCTGLGALRRRPEARWRRQPGEVAGLAKLQRELLASAISLVRPGGVVLYATCSPHLSETVTVVADAVRRYGVTALDTRELVPGVPDLGDGPSVQLWPHRHGTDAMFFAALRKPAA
ncbi:RsmB/NOP family class I SAM-dependent RNA methyltransferase [Rhodococcus sp. WMMA185]|uniref:RsmB/NOP family class I SAM-dependent RNA methyltransferase n=1 Tax=Rhodococcus sp. WMMA185 TaxID=679318 RepID=UPI0009FE66D0|nr:transcription antitermination factor NusB [Rhodococcus sp. WMMA185]